VKKTPLIKNEGTLMKWRTREVEMFQNVFLKFFITMITIIIKDDDNDDDSNNKINRKLTATSNTHILLFSFIFNEFINSNEKVVTDKIHSDGFRVKTVMSTRVHVVSNKIIRQIIKQRHARPDKKYIV
jgi:hypothetical protein